MIKRRKDFDYADTDIEKLIKTSLEAGVAVAVHNVKRKVIIGATLMTYDIRGRVHSAKKERLLDDAIITGAMK